jgi:hypothetical protein
VFKRWTEKRMARAQRLIAEGEARAAQARADYEAHMAARGLEVPPPVAPPASLREAIKLTVDGVKSSLGETFDDRRDVLDPGGADLNHPPPEVEDPAERERIAAAERAARDVGRAPYAAPVEISFTRFSTTASNQLDDLEAVLRETGLAAHPERVYGAYRVPTRFELDRNRERDVRVDWELAHAPGPLPPAADAVTATGFERDDELAVRRPGEASVLDEDVAGELIRRSGAAPEDCFGLHRLLEVRGGSGEDTFSWRAVIRGVVLFSRPLPALRAARAAMSAEAPLELGAPPFHVEILDWEAVAAWVSPFRHGPPRVPSPLPHLPSTWQELLAAYVLVVGLQPRDTYGVQVTRTRDRSIADLSAVSFARSMRGKHPFMDVGEHVVLAYRDSEAYRAGRARWHDYQRDVLRARLDHLTGVRPPVDGDPPYCGVL